MALHPGPFSFTEDRIRRIWREGQVGKGTRNSDQYQSFDCDASKNFANLEKTRKFCFKLCASVQDPVSHVDRLDSALDMLWQPMFGRATFSEDIVSAVESR